MKRKNEPAVVRIGLAATLLLAVLALVAVLVPCPTVAADQPLSAAEAKHHIGEDKTVCGKVVSATYARRSRGQPTFINLDKPYPKHVFTAVIWAGDRQKFRKPPEVELRDKRICVKGEITEYRGKAQIVVKEPKQIEIQETKN